MLRLTNPVGLSLIGSGGFDPAAQAFFNALATAGYPASATYKNQVNTLISALRIAGELSDIYALYDFSARDFKEQGYVNMVAPASYAITPSGTLNWVSNQGITPAATTADGMTTAFNPNAVGVGADDFAVSIFFRTNVAASTRFDHGATGTSGYFVRARVATDTGNFRLNGTATLSLPVAVTDTIGFWTWNCHAVNTRQVFKNGVQQGGDIGMTSAAPPNANLVFGNARIGTDTSTQRQLSLGILRRKTSAARELAFYNCLVPFLTSKGIL